MKSLRARALASALFAILCTGLPADSALAQALRPEIGKPLKQASELLRAGKAKEALAKVREAEAVPNRSAAEQLTIERMKGAAAQRAGDSATAIDAFEAAMASGKLAPAEQGQIAESLAFAYSLQRNWPKATEWADKARRLGVASPQLNQLVTYVRTQSGDFAAVARDAQAAVTAAEQAGRKPDEGDLLRLADAQLRTGDTAGHAATLEKLLAAYPKKEYWSAYLPRLPRKPGWSDRYALDLFRLRLATDTLERPDEYMEAAQLALQAGLPAEAVRVLDRGYQAGVLGSGPEAQRQQRLRDLANRQLAEAQASSAARAASAAGEAAGDELVKAGYALASLGDADRGIALMRQGIAKGGLKRPDEAKLHLGMAELAAPAHKAAGVQTLKSVKGRDGSGDLARLWLLANR